MDEQRIETPVQHLIHEREQQPATMPLPIEDLIREREPIADEIKLWEPSEWERGRIEREAAKRTTLPSERAAQKRSSSEKLYKVHCALIERYGLPWTIERLGEVNYIIVAINGKFFDPRGYARRPILNPMQDPALDHTVRVDIVKTMQANDSKAVALRTAQNRNGGMRKE